VHASTGAGVNGHKSGNTVFALRLFRDLVAAGHKEFVTPCMFVNGACGGGRGGGRMMLTEVIDKVLVDELEVMAVMAVVIHKEGRARRVSFVQITLSFSCHFISYYFVSCYLISCYFVTHLVLVGSQQL
jgi:hypothetical protein